MSIAPIPRRDHSFTGHSVANPDVPHSGVALDRTIDATNRSVAEVIEMVSKIQQDDGRMQPEIIYLRNLAPEVYDWLIRLFGGEFVVVPETGEPGGGSGTPGPGSTLSGIGITALTQARDFPRSYGNAAGHLLRVAIDGSGRVEFWPLEIPPFTVQGAQDVPDFEGNALRLFQVNAAENGIAFINLPIDPNGEYARLDQGNDWNLNTQENMRLGRIQEKVVDLGNVSGVTDIDPSTANLFTCVMTGPVTFQVTAPPPNGFAYIFTIRVHAPAGGQVMITSGDWGYQQVASYDEGSGEIVYNLEARPAPTLPAGSYILIAGYAFADGRISALVQ